MILRSWRCALFAAGLVTGCAGSRVPSVDGGHDDRHDSGAPSMDGGVGDASRMDAGVDAQRDDLDAGGDADTDCDDDGVTDEIERSDGLDPCDPDSDDDGFDDLVEHEYACVDCPERGPRTVGCECAVSASCGIVPPSYVVTLPHGGTGIVVDAELIVPSAAPPTPVDVSLLASDDPCDSGGVDATRFVQVISPETIVGATPGARVSFRVTLHDAFLMERAERRVFIVFLDARVGTTVFERRQVFVVVPAASS